MAVRTSSGFATNLPLLPRRLQLPVALRGDLLLPSRQHVLRGDVARGTVQPDVVVVVHITLRQTPCIIKRQRRPGPDALPFEHLLLHFSDHPVNRIDELLPWNLGAELVAKSRRAA